MTGGAPLVRIAEIGVLPVVVIDDAARAVAVAEALREGGIGCAEVTLRTPEALRALAAMAAVPDFVTVAGTVLDAEQARQAVDAGAQALVSPGFDEGVLRVARRHDLGLVPGVATATEIQRAWNAGLRTLKLFPAEVLGGLAAIRALSGPFPDVRFVPSGGLTLENSPGYAASPHVLAVSGSWMATREAIAAGEFEEITRRSRRTVELVRG